MQLNLLQCCSLFRNDFIDSLSSLKFKTCPQIDKNVTVILSLAWVKYLMVGQGWIALFHVWYCKRLCITFSKAFAFEDFILLSCCGVESNECFHFCCELLQSEMAFESFLASISRSGCGFEPKTHKDSRNIPLSARSPEVLTVEYSELAKRCT